MKPKKIVFLFRDMGTGGAQKIEAFVANALHKEGHEVIAINMAATECTVNIDPHIRIVDFPLEITKSGVYSLLYKLSYVLGLRRMIKSLKPDLLCAFLSDVVRIAVLATAGLKIPIIGSERGDPNVYTEKQFQKYKKAYKKCVAVVFQLANVAEMYHLPSEVQQYVIPNPCVPRRNEYTHTCTQGEHVIISAGRLVEQKRFDLLIAAFEMVYTRFPEYKLRIYGDGPLRSALEAQVKTSCAKDAVILAGDTADVFNEAYDAEFFVLSSDFEGIPNVLLEAMACGIACISTDCSPGGASFLLKDGERGLVVPVGDKDSLADAMIQYILVPELRIENEKKGMQVITEFSPKSIQDEWIKVFNTCLR